ncbi:fluoride efflux transporter CrcB [Sphingomonas sp. ASV193]|uniref:fluoride efflux transporter CrcB n=1 Tax=Sphingomonas sp. ASV193 TaxID=3144405 RepID=UPI0032E8A6CE
MNSFLLVFLGGGLGAAARHGVNRLGLATLGPGFPWWTVAINLLGCLVMGMTAGLFARSGASPDTRLFLTTGVLGGFTTFSAFSLDALTLWQRGQQGAAVLYVALSVVLSLAAVAVGALLVRA